MSNLSPHMSRAICLLLLCVAALACDKGPTKPTGSAAAAPAPGVTQPAEPSAQPPAEGKKFGAGVALPEVTPIADILADPKKFAGQTVRVEGMITDVCPKRGCWFEMAGQKPGQKLRFKVTDGEMVFPVEAKGGQAIAEGVVTVKELTLEETKAHAEYQAKEYGIAYDPDSITEPKAIVQIAGTGAVFRDKN
jgi:hypothetical protein